MIDEEIIGSKINKFMEEELCWQIWIEFCSVTEKPSEQLSQELFFEQEEQLPIHE